MFFNIFSPLSKGIEYMRREEYSLAIQHFNSLLDKNVKPAAAHFNLGRCFFKLNEPEQARLHLNKALDVEFSENIIRSTLEITNWKLLSSYNYFNSWPCFSHDSSLLAYASARSCSNGDGKINSQDCSGIYIVDLLTGSETQVVSEEYYNFHPMFSPDDRSIVYLSVRNKPGKPGVIDYRANPGFYMMNLSAGAETMLLDDSYKIKHFVFTPDGKKIILSGWLPRQRNSGIFELDIETKELKTIVSGYYECTFPWLSKDGRKLVYSSWRTDTKGDGVIDFKDNSGIYLRNMASGTEAVIASDRYNNVFPSFSPDGIKIMYLSYRKDTNKDGRIDSTDNPGIYVYNLADMKERLVIDEKSFNKFPSFTADNKKIVFLSSWRAGWRRYGRKDFFENKGIYMADIETRAVTNVVSDKYYGSHSPVVSPNGELVAYTSFRRETNRGLFIANLNRLPSKEELKGFIERNI